MNLEINDYIINSYGFLLERGKLTSSKELADLIKANFNLNHPKNKFVYDYLNKNNHLQFDASYQKGISLTITNIN